MDQPKKRHISLFLSSLVIISVVISEKVTALLSVFDWLEVSNNFVMDYCIHTSEI